MEAGLTVNQALDEPAGFDSRATHYAAISTDIDVFENRIVDVMRSEPSFVEGSMRARPTGEAADS
jgi:hypothetical protein